MRRHARLQRRTSAVAAVTARVVDRRRARWSAWEPRGSPASRAGWDRQLRPKPPPRRRIRAALHEAAARSRPVHAGLSQLRAHLKLLVGLSPATIFYTYHGTLDAAVPGRGLVPLLRTTSLVRRLVEPQADGWRVTIWEATVYHRAGEDEPAGELREPAERAASCSRSTSARWQPDAVHRGRPVLPAGRATDRAARCRGCVLA